MKPRITSATTRIALTVPARAWARALALASVLLLFGTACREIETGKTRLKREGSVYTLALDGERIVRFTVPEPGAGGLPRADVGNPAGAGGSPHVPVT
jgi:hypothetical protein